MSITWSTKKQETTITLSHDAKFRRGDFIKTSGFVNGQNNGVFVVRRVKDTYCIVEPAGWWDYVVYYAKKFCGRVQWEFWGVICDLEDMWNNLRR